MTDLLSYYDSRLLDDAIRLPETLWLSLKTSLASRQTVFTLFEAKLIPLPYPDDPQSALQWNTRAPYLAISEDQMEFSVLFSVQFERCLASSKYRICSETSLTEIKFKKIKLLALRPFLRVFRLYVFQFVMLLLFLHYLLNKPH